jgi:hypothetical protein
VKRKSIEQKKRKPIWKEAMNMNNLMCGYYIIYRIRRSGAENIGWWRREGLE